MYFKYKILLFFCTFISICFGEEVISEHRVVILGGGIGGLTAANYLALGGEKPLVVEGKIRGGLLAESPCVQNWPAEIRISGAALTERVREQAEKNGAQIVSEEIVDVNFSSSPFVITTKELGGSKKEHKRKALSCVVAMGTTPKTLNISGEKEHIGQGVSFCATCDGPLYKDQTVAVIGGGKSAVVETEHLAKLAKKVYLITRKGKIDLFGNHANVEIIANSIPLQIIGDEEKVKSLKIQSIDKSVQKTLPVDGVFVAIGAIPNTTIFKGKIELDKEGFIVLKDGQKTSQNGVWAIGDIADPIYRQAITAAGSGAKAAVDIQYFLTKFANKPEIKKASFTTFQEEKAEFSVTQNSVVELHSEQELTKILAERHNTVVVEFFATWCGPCRATAPILEKGAQKLSNGVKVFKINIDNCPNLRYKWKVLSLPTLLVFRKGEIVDRKKGVDEISQLIEEKFAEYR